MKIGRKKFKAWLDTRSPFLPVGRVGSADSCPLATFLCDTQGKGWVVGGDIFGNANDPTMDMIPLPNWAREFVHLVDTRGSRGEAVTVDQAKRYLEEIKWTSPPMTSYTEMVRS